MKTHQIRSRSLIASLLGDNLVSMTCRSGNNLQLCTSLPLRTHTHYRNISPNSVRQRCWDIVIVQLKSHLKRTTLIISLMLPFGEASQALVFRREMLLDSVT